MYLDPSFGGMLLQVIVVIVAVGGAVVYSLRRKIRDLFMRKSGPNAASADRAGAPADLNAHGGAKGDMIDTLAKHGAFDYNADSSIEKTGEGE